MAEWSRALPDTACCAWGRIPARACKKVVSDLNTCFLPHLQLKSYDLTAIWQSRGVINSVINSD